MKTLILGLIVGPLIAEFAGYFWHRHVAHMGVLRWLPNDFLRRRHFHHHEVYPAEQLRTPSYLESCDNPGWIILGTLTSLTLLGCVLAKFLSFSDFLAMTSGAIIYAFLILNYVHESYHIKYLELKKRWLFQFRITRKIYIWLRRCHDIHHLINANYFILIPVDWFFGTLVTKVQQRRDDLFPGFDPQLSSTCDQPLIRR